MLYKERTMRACISALLCPIPLQAVTSAHMFTSLVPPVSPHASFPKPGASLHTACPLPSPTPPHTWVLPHVPLQHL